MNTEIAPKPRLHPLVATAAVAVTVFSLAGIAAVAGGLPAGKATPAEIAVAPPPPAASVATPPPAAPVVQAEQKAASEQPRPAVEKSASKPVPKRIAKTSAPSVPASEAQPAVAQVPVAAEPPPPPPCTNCGMIDNIREVTDAGQASGLGAVAGGVVGGVLGHQVGKGSGNTLATILAAAGGAYAGHQIEKSRNKTTHYAIDVRMHDGTTRSFTQEGVPAWRIGDKVRVENGGLVAN